MPQAGLHAIGVIARIDFIRDGSARQHSGCSCALRIERRRDRFADLWVLALQLSECSQRVPASNRCRRYHGMQARDFKI